MKVSWHPPSGAKSFVRLLLRGWNFRFRWRRVDGVGLSVMFELLGPLQIHQPRFAPADPEFVAGYDVAGSKIESAERYLRLVTS